MKKVLLSTLLVAGLVSIILGSGLVLVGYISKEEPKETTSSSGVKTEKVDREAAKEAARKKTEEEKMESLLPNIKTYFPNGEITTFDPDGGVYWSFEIDGVTEEEFNKFKEACKADEWFNVDVDDFDVFYAYTYDNGHYLMLLYSNDNLTVSVTDKKKVAENEEKAKEALEDSDVNVEYNVEINTGE